MPITSTPSNLSNLAKGSLAAKISAAQTTGITVTADAYTTASGMKYGQFPTGNSILKLTSTTQSNVTKVEFMGVESASQTGAAVTLGTCIRDLDWEDGSDFTSQSDGMAFPAGTTVELVWTVQHAENTPFKNNANTFTGAQTFAGGVTAEGMVTLTGGLRVPVFADTTARDAFYTAPENGDKAYVTGVGDQTYSAGDWVTINATATDLATEAAAGTVEIGTEAQVDTETDTGETGAFLVARPSHIVSQNNLASTEEGKGSALVGHEGGTTVKAKLDGLDADIVSTAGALQMKEAAETIAEGLLPCPIFIKPEDGKIYISDANDAARLVFHGFAITNAYIPVYGNVIAFAGNNSDYENIGANKKIAQGFTPSKDYDAVTKVSFWGSKGSATESGTIRVGICSGTKDAAYLTSVDVAVSTLTAYGSPAWNEITLTTPIALTGSTQYYLRIEVLSGHVSEEIRWSSDTGNAYAGGTEWVFDGSTWTERATRDKSFRIWGTETTTVTEGITIQRDGVVSGFTGLTPNVDYFVQDTIGTIGTGVGTFEVPVGMSISATQILIQKPSSMIYVGTANASGQANGSTITVPANARIAIVTLATPINATSVYGRGDVTLTRKGRTAASIGEGDNGSTKITTATWVDNTITITTTGAADMASTASAHFYR
jgi:predicted regulator of Ras-like GTPase activity (Roadblock/LC7/MglB family)